MLISWNDPVLTCLETFNEIMHLTRFAKHMREMNQITQASGKPLAFPRSGL